MAGFCCIHRTIWSTAWQCNSSSVKLYEVNSELTFVHLQQFNTSQYLYHLLAHLDLLVLVYVPDMRGSGTETTLVPASPETSEPLISSHYVPHEYFHDFDCFLDNRTRGQSWKLQDSYMITEELITRLN